MCLPLDAVHLWCSGVDCVVHAFWCHVWCVSFVVMVVCDTGCVRGAGHVVWAVCVVEDMQCRLCVMQAGCVCSAEQVV